MIQKELTFTKANGQRIAAKAYIPSGEGTKYPTVIFAHGFNGNYRQLMHHGACFADAGTVCLFFDFCGGGTDTLSDGSLQEMTALTEAEDLKTVMAEAVKLSYVDSDRIFLLGESMGGFVSAYVAAQMPERVKGLVLWYPAFVIPDDAKRRFENGEDSVFGLKLSPDYDAVAKDIDIDELMAGYSGPVKLIHGDMDEVVPIAYSQRALGTYKNADLTVIKGAGHGFDGDDSVTAGRLSVEFITGAL